VESAAKFAHLLPAILAISFFEGIRLIRFFACSHADRYGDRSEEYLADHAHRRRMEAYRLRDLRGTKLAHCAPGRNQLIPERVIFHGRVKVGGWPGWLTVQEATERVDATLQQRWLNWPARENFEHLETWLDAFSIFVNRMAAGTFSLDAHLQNFGVCGDRICCSIREDSPMTGRSGDPPFS